LKTYASVASTALLVGMLAAQGGAAVPDGHVISPAATGPSALRGAHHRRSPAGPIQHIVIIIQENRSLDNLFNGFCVGGGSICANTVTVDPVTGTPLVQMSLAAPFGPSHSHKQFVQEYDNGKMDGFNNISGGCKTKSGCDKTVFAYVPSSETTIYQQLATVDGELSDATFQTNSGPSFPAHLYAIAGQAGGEGDDTGPWAIAGGSGSCAQPKNDVQILMTSPYPGKQGNKQPSCKNFTTIFDLLANAGYSWRYYSNAAQSFFSAPPAIQHLSGSPNFIYPSTQFLKDVAGGTLANVTYVMPWSEKVSDHPEEVKDPSAGPDWVASLVNAIGETPFWSNTAIVIWWDDWGGWYDHVPPPAPPFSQDPYEYSFRVPLIVASPYARVGSMDHEPRTFVSALRLIEETFGLSSLGTTDQYEPDGLDTMFNFKQSPIPYTPLGGSNARPFRGLHPASRRT
jgi:phospholipase C